MSETTSEIDTEKSEKLTNEKTGFLKLLLNDPRRAYDQEKLKTGISLVGFIVLIVTFYLLLV